jgi:hypothetical protein
MLSLSSLFAISGAVVYAYGLLKMVNAALEAPIGYEDDSGFHYGIAADEIDGQG